MSSTGACSACPGWPTIHGMNPSSHADVVRRETVANTIATVVIAALLSALIFRGRVAIRPFETPPGGIFGILPGTFNFTLLVTIVLTLVVRGRVRRNRLERLQAGHGSMRGALLPANVLLRGLALALLATLVLVPVSGGLVYGLVAVGVLPPSWSLAGMAVYFTVHFVVLSLLVTPVVVWRALRD